MSPHLTCLKWGINFHITSRPDPEAGHKRDFRCQLRHIKWGLILKLSMSLFSWHPPKSLRIFFHFESPSRPVVVFITFPLLTKELKKPSSQNLLVPNPVSLQPWTNGFPKTLLLFLLVIGTSGLTLRDHKLL